MKNTKKKNRKAFQTAYNPDSKKHYKKELHKADELVDEFSSKCMILTAALYYVCPDHPLFTVPNGLLSDIEREAAQKICETKNFPKDDDDRIEDDTLIFPEDIENVKFKPQHIEQKEETKEEIIKDPPKIVKDLEFKLDLKIDESKKEVSEEELSEELQELQRDVREKMASSQKPSRAKIEVIQGERGDGSFKDVRKKFGNDVITENVPGEWDSAESANSTITNE